MIEIIAGSTTLPDLLSQRSGAARGVRAATLTAWNEERKSRQEIGVLVRENTSLGNAPMLVVGVFESASVMRMKLHDSSSLEWTVFISRVGYTMADGDTLRVFQDDEPLVGAYRYANRILSLQDASPVDAQELDAAMKSIAEAF